MVIIHPQTSSRARLELDPIRIDCQALACFPKKIDSFSFIGPLDSTAEIISLSHFSVF